MEQFTRVVRQVWQASRGSISLLLVLVCGSLFLAVTALDVLRIVSRSEVLVAVGLSSSGISHGKLYQFVTAPLFHGGLLHALFNLLALWMLGPQVERVLGRARYVVLSVLCAESSLVGFLLLSWGTNTVAFGYSGVIFGLLVAQALFFPDSTVAFFGIFPLKMKYAALIMGAMLLYLSIGSEGGGAVHAADLFGGVAALLFLRGPQWFRARLPGRWAWPRVPSLPFDTLSGMRRVRGWWNARRRGPAALCPHDSCGHLGRGILTGQDDTVFRCSRCQHRLPGCGSKATHLAIALLGSPHCGQTSWLLRCLDCSRERMDRMSFVLDGQEAQWRGALSALGLGTPPQKTPPVPGTAWCVECVKGGAARRLYLYDVGGDEVSERERLSRHQCFRHVGALIVMIDPFGFPELQKKYGALVRGMRPPVAPTSRTFSEEDLVTLLQTLEAARPAPRDGRWDLSVAVVVTKLDVLGLARHFEADIAGSPGNEQTCRKKLEEWGFGNMLRRLELHFARVACFATHARGSGTFSPANPLMWALDL